MRTDADDLVRVTTGDLTGMQIAHDLLKDAGIASRVVGDDLTAGLGTALPGSVELWVHRSDLEKAEAALTDLGHAETLPKRGDKPLKRPRESFPHPTDDPNPAHTKGPR